MTLQMILPGGLTLFGDGRRLESGFYISEGEFNWFSGVDIRRDEVPRAQAHGSFDTPGFLTARLVTVDGFCVARNDAELEHLGNQLKAVLNDGSSGRVVVEWNDVSTWADVRLAAMTKFVPSPVGQVARFQLSLWAADPRKYGDTRLFASSALAYHYGNFPAAPVFTVSGARVGGYAINGSDGSVYASSATVVVDHPHVIDTATGFRTVDGVVAHGNVTSATFKPLPGGAQISYSIVGAGLTLAVAVMDTFV